MRVLLPEAGKLELDQLVGKVSAGTGGGGASGGRGTASADVDSMTRDHWNEAKVS